MTPTSAPNSTICTGAFLPTARTANSSRRLHWRRADHRAGRDAHRSAQRNSTASGYATYSTVRIRKAVIYSTRRPLWAEAEVRGGRLGLRLSSSFRTGTGKISETPTFSSELPARYQKMDRLPRVALGKPPCRQRGRGRPGASATGARSKNAGFPNLLVNTWYLVKQLVMLGEICGALGEPFDEKYEMPSLRRASRRCD